jgi:hypothetical protein
MAHDDQFRREQADLVKLIKDTGGFDQVPINDETLRPFLQTLWNIGEKNGEVVWCFDTPEFPDRIYHGLRGDPKKVDKIALKLQAELLVKFSRAEIRRAKPVYIKGTNTSMLHFEGVWIPKAALASRRN